MLHIIVITYSHPESHSYSSSDPCGDFFGDSHSDYPFDSYGDSHLIPLVIPMVIHIVILILIPTVIFFPFGDFRAGACTYMPILYICRYVCPCPEPNRLGKE